MVVLEWNHPLNKTKDHGNFSSTFCSHCTIKQQPNFIINSYYPTSWFTKMPSKSFTIIDT